MSAAFAEVLNAWFDGDTGGFEIGVARATAREGVEIDIASARLSKTTLDIS